MKLNRSCISRCQAMLMTARYLDPLLMQSPKDPMNDLVERWLFDGEIDHGEFAEQLRGEGGDLLPFDLELHLRSIVSKGPREDTEALQGHRFPEADTDMLGRRERSDQPF